MNYAIIVIDYYLQFVETGSSRAEAASKAKSFLDRFQDKMTGSEYGAITDIIDRMSK